VAPHIGLHPLECHHLAGSIGQRHAPVDDVDIRFRQKAERLGHPRGDRLLGGPASGGQERPAEADVGRVRPDASRVELAPQKRHELRADGQFCGGDGEAWGFCERNAED
jgi:hypothetical protein